MITKKQRNSSEYEPTTSRILKNFYSHQFTDQPHHFSIKDRIIRPLYNKNYILLTFFIKYSIVKIGNYKFENIDCFNRNI